MGAFMRVQTPESVTDDEVLLLFYGHTQQYILF